MSFIKKPFLELLETPVGGTNTCHYDPLLRRQVIPPVGRLESEALLDCRQLVNAIGSGAHPVTPLLPGITPTSNPRGYFFSTATTWRSFANSRFLRCCSPSSCMVSPLSDGNATLQVVQPVAGREHRREAGPRS